MPMPLERPSIKDRMKLYVWEGVFLDYYPGMAVAVAYNVTQARKAIAWDLWPDENEGSSRLRDRVIKELKRTDPDVIRFFGRQARILPKSWSIGGGG